MIKNNFLSILVKRTIYLVALHQLRQILASHRVRRLKHLLLRRGRNQTLISYHYLILAVELGANLGQ